MRMHRPRLSLAIPFALVALPTLLAACNDGGKACCGPPPEPPKLDVVGQGVYTERYTAELTVRGNYAYTSTWGTRGPGLPGNVVNVWNVSGATPTLVRSITVPGAGQTTGDIQVSDDGTLLIVATERGNGSIVIYDLADPANPTVRSVFSSAHTVNGVHTAEVQRVNGKLYGFLSIDPASAAPARLTIVDLSNPSAPVEVFSQEMGNPFVHDVFVRDGILFTALWNDGLTLWDIGGAGRGGTPAAPVTLGNVHTFGGDVHNLWWFHDPSTGAKRYAFIGQEGPSSGLGSSSGDVHVVDVSDMTAPHEVAFYHVAGAGTHNFSMDEANGILYAAFYNAGVRALDVRGDLSACTAAQKDATGRCDLGQMGRELAAGLTNKGNVYVWGVQYDGGSYVYASDMLNGLWKLTKATR
jgi:hypothetical protein